MPRSHIQVAVTSDPSAFDSMVGIMAGRGFEGFWEDGGTLKGYISSDAWDDNALADLHAAFLTLTSTLNLPPPLIQVQLIPAQNWNTAWEATVRPIRAGTHFVIAPTWHPVVPSLGDIVVTIDPKMSFGTGYHETTRLMLTLLERYLPPRARVLDVGTGSGILAIGALKLGATSAIGIDIDDWAYDNARENGHLNDVSERLSIRPGDLSSVNERGFDLVMANIQKDIIEEMLPGLLERLATDGWLLLSGLLYADRTAMLSVLEGAGLTPQSEERENEWVAFAVRRQ